MNNQMILEQLCVTSCYRLTSQLLLSIQIKTHKKNKKKIVIFFEKRVMLSE